MYDGVIQQAASGQPEVPVAPSKSFAEFYAAKHAPMARLAYLLTGSVDVAQDLTQDAFVRLHIAWPRVVNPDAYLRTSVINACRSYHRRRLRERRVTVAPSPTTEPLRAEELFDALAALPYRQRAAVVLRYWHDCSEAEIAEVLGCQVGTVGSLVHRALVQLRRVIDQ